MFHKIKNVKPLENYILEIVFENEVIKYYDVSKLFDKWSNFQSLITVKGLFEQVKVDTRGLWNFME